MSVPLTVNNGPKEQQGVESYPLEVRLTSTKAEVCCDGAGNNDGRCKVYAGGGGERVCVSDGVDNDVAEFSNQKQLREYLYSSSAAAAGTCSLSTAALGDVALEMGTAVRAEEADNWVNVTQDRDPSVVVKDDDDEYNEDELTGVVVQT